jgi:hypothetical protein
MGSKSVQGNAANEESCLAPIEFARLSGLSLSTVRRYLACGKLPKYQPGGPRCRVLIPRYVVDELLNCESRYKKNQDGPTPTSNETESGNRLPIKSDSSGPPPRWMDRRG